jgi:hypothetical protein
MNQRSYLTKAIPQKQAVTVHEAVQNSPTLGQLTALIQDSSARLKAIESLIPETLRPFVQAGPIDGDIWCLLVTGNAAAAKMRQLTPLIRSRLLGEGWKVTSIRLKILIGQKPAG